MHGAHLQQEPAVPIRDARRVEGRCDEPGLLFSKSQCQTPVRMRVDLFGLEWARTVHRIDRNMPLVPGVCHSSPFVGQSPPLGRPFRQTHQLGFEVDAFDEIVAPMGEIVQQMGRSGIRLTRSHFVDNLPPLGRTVRPIIHPVFVVDAFDEWFAPMGEIVQKNAEEWHTSG